MSQRTRFGVYAFPDKKMPMSTNRHNKTLIPLLGFSDILFVFPEFAHAVLNVVYVKNE